MSKITSSSWWKSLCKLLSILFLFIPVIYFILNEMYNPIKYWFALSIILIAITFKDDFISLETPILTLKLKEKLNEAEEIKSSIKESMEIITENQISSLRKVGYFSEPTVDDVLTIERLMRKSQLSEKFINDKKNDLKIIIARIMISQLSICDLDNVNFDKYFKFNNYNYPYPEDIKVLIDATDYVNPKYEGIEFNYEQYYNGFDYISNK